MNFKSYIKKLWDKNKFVLIGTGILVVIGLLLNIYFEKQAKVFVIGSLIDIESPVRGDLLIVFSYKLNNKAYEFRSRISDREYDMDKRYFVGVPIKFPSRGFLLLDKPVPDSIKSAPPEGWKELPIKFEE